MLLLLFKNPSLSLPWSAYKRALGSFLEREAEKEEEEVEPEKEAKGRKLL